jgi:hypothetical protein
LTPLAAENPEPHNVAQTRVSFYWQIFADFNLKKTWFWLYTEGFFMEKE